MSKFDQERIFRWIGSAGLEGGFGVGERLPKEKGSLKDFKIIRMPAVDGQDYAAFERRLIEKLGESPKRGAEVRARQLHALIAKSTGKGKMFIVIISRAHLLSSHTLRCLKSLHEMGGKAGSNPGFILLGKMEPLTALIKKEPGVDLRTTLLPTLK